MKMLVLPFLILCASSFTFSIAIRIENSPEIWDTSTDAEQNITVLEIWQNAEKTLKNMAHAAVKTILPSLMESSRTMNISSECTKQVLQVLAGLRNIKSWAMRFFDASGKIVDGLMVGSISSFGVYDECLETEVKSAKFHEKGKILFRGQYCAIDLKLILPPKRNHYKLENVLEEFKNFSQRDTAIAEMSKFAQLFYFLSFRLGLCVPSGCSLYDVDQLVKPLGKSFYVNASAKRCEGKENAKFTPFMIFVIACFSFSGFLMFIGTVIDLYGYYKKIIFKSIIIRILVAYSLFTNFRKFVNTNTSSETLSCLNGMRFLTMSWVIIGHAYMFVDYKMFLGLLKAQSYAKDFAFQAVINAYFSVDTFFFIGGLLVCYVTMKLVREQKYNLSVPIYILHRLWRIVPVYFHVLMFTFLFELLSSGPIWYDTIEEHFKSCYKNWWTNLLFINNFYNSKNMCLQHTWYIASDFQMYVGALFILIPLIRWPRVGISLTIISIISCIIYSGIGTYIKGYPPALLLSNLDKDQRRDYWVYFYTRPFVHVGPYCIGILSGYLLATKPKLKIHPFIQMVGWSLAFICNFSVLYGVFEWNKGSDLTLLDSIVYASLSRSAWTLGVAWMVIACATGHGGIINYILSWKAFIPLGRLTYVAYLVHPFVQFASIGSARTQLQPDHFLAVWIYCGYLFITYAVSFVGSMLVEAPFISLEKILLPKAGKKGDELARRKHDIFNDTLQKEKNGDIAAIVIKQNEESEGIDNTAVVCRL